ncbi:methyltransferase protein 2 A like [Trichuris trichiura]|uniref:tRNA N(3)-methylcytidine methyltransferase n=1 Tax=Trichuris trichiura TaxID=36087 RepID=A0A077Z7H3_TRITR|nr:methyltransferase protein 2 A like [Trichuris trichiura]
MPLEEHENSRKRPQFGSRTLKDEDDIFLHNAWDNVEWNAERASEAAAKVLENSSPLISSQEAEKYEQQSSLYWDEFYRRHRCGFFKDRNWLFTEFPELNCFINAKTTHSSSPVECKCLLEVGCGVGNTVIPLMQATAGSDLQIYACDFSPVAVDLLRQSEEFDASRCHAFVWDICDEKTELPFQENSLDFALLIFVLSSLNPAKFGQAVANIVRYVKPGGMILFRDYGRYDMAQLRFKKGRCLSDNFYARGDGTRVYFFMPEEVDALFAKCGLQKVFLHVDRRLQVNRIKLLRMYRVWIQATYKKA